ncbi:ubiquinol-cytochrome c reductase cytochrome c subunit [Actinoalloteichus hoggarensis]|uniref:Cytochrome bc1 complex cytochrome c subunit n=1 Tax=Actinoalloteichus hoggarensis TaxID=1470176 RepID=A0A221W867_9PSEU|nr:c-type cytochrome [Actinoalloteichus hoggarensis]ASO22190.1 Menaquinol-cytochrome c reductase cytochrome c subunit [Actinoalloteichus hoggarensis]MBB5923725.1 ubiquinol-cytochrome c reductase cytochrome c subunit [Actinoalloteichus hoggarensis]
MTTTDKPRSTFRSKLRRRISGVLALGVALAAAGALYTAFMPKPHVAQATEQAELERQGEELYNNACITCHGVNLEGVQDRGPSLIGTGEAAVHFQVSTGRMPLMRQDAQALRKPSVYDSGEIEALGAYIQANGGGPETPEARGAELRGDNPARGGELFRLNCASCHNFTGRGGALSSGKFAPNLDGVSEDEIYTAMLTGPQNMPVFSDRQLTPTEKEDIIAFVKSVTDGNNNPGGLSLGGFGPAVEGVVVFVVGIAALVGVSLWIGAKQ